MKNQIPITEQVARLNKIAPKYHPLWESLEIGIILFVIGMFILAGLRLYFISKKKDQESPQNSNRRSTDNGAVKGEGESRRITYIFQKIADFGAELTILQNTVSRNWKQWIEFRNNQKEFSAETKEQYRKDSELLKQEYVVISESLVQMESKIDNLNTAVQLYIELRIKNENG